MFTTDMEEEFFLKHNQGFSQNAFIQTKKMRKSPPKNASFKKKT